MIDLGNLNDDKLKTLQINFLEAISVAFVIFDKDAFKRSLAEPTGNKVVNKPLFEAVSVCLALIDNSERQKLTEQKDAFRESLKLMLKDETFVKSITLSTANTESVLTRFDKIKGLIKQLLSKDLL